MFRVEYSAIAPKNVLPDRERQRESEKERKRERDPAERVTIESPDSGGREKERKAWIDREGER